MTELGNLHAGAASFDVSPNDSQFLFGYPHVRRQSTGIHDPLLASALYLRSGAEQLLFIGTDVIFIPKWLALFARDRIAASTGIPRASIMVTATHTHSGPTTVACLSNEADPVVPKPDKRYLDRLEDGIVQAAQHAVSRTSPAVVGLVEAEGSCVGGNRRDPSGSVDPRVPVLAVRQRDTEHLLGLMVVSAMHPTVLHEDSTLVSADFPGSTRRIIRESIAGADCPIVWHTGPCGDQSPRHVTRENTFAEADRLGHELAENITTALGQVDYRETIRLSSTGAEVLLPLRQLPNVQEARASLELRRVNFERLRDSQAPPATVRAAEVDWFGAEETLALAQAAQEGRLKRFAEACMPAEIQVFRIGPWTFVGWPGEIFVEFGLRVARQSENTYVISLANGELQGYLVTEDAIRAGSYEANNALFESPASGDLLVEKTLELLRPQ
ncbi:MAG: neutral/alkaline non-lysosomal ceramidase N-terminal domain-containing protein [Pirellulales bacterium]|nr:neutral/alkaline non-lysosomal ceramidase N-terminal domain-containing protein [Pirellulales bacterium]